MIFGQKLGKALEVKDVIVDDTCKSFMRLRAEYHVIEPLVPGAWVLRLEGDGCSIEFKYEGFHLSFTNVEGLLT